MEVQINGYIGFHFKCYIMTWKTQCISLNGMSLLEKNFKWLKSHVGTK